MTSLGEDVPASVSVASSASGSTATSLRASPQMIPIATSKQLLTSLPQLMDTTSDGSSTPIEARSPQLGPSGGSNGTTSGGSFHTPIKVMPTPPQPQPSPTLPISQRTLGGALHSRTESMPEKNYIIIPRNTALASLPTGATVTTTTTTLMTSPPTQHKDLLQTNTSNGLLISSPVKFGNTRNLRPGRSSLSRDGSKETISPAGLPDLPLSTSTSTSSLTTTSIFHPHPPTSGSSPATTSAGTVLSPQHGATMISTTTSITHVGNSPANVPSEDTKLPSVQPPVTAASLTASLLAAAKESTASQAQQQHLSLPAIVAAHQTRIAQLETVTTTQSESILELRQMIRNLQKQLVMVMASVPSTSGTGGVSSLAPYAAHPTPVSRKTSASSLDGGGGDGGGSGGQPHRSRSSTELTNRQQRNQLRLSGGKLPMDGIVSGLHFGAHTDSMDSLPGTGGHTARSAKSSSRPGSKRGSAYNSPRVQRKTSAKALHATSPHHGANHTQHQQQQQQQLGVKGSSHHFSFHPQIATQPPPGQILVEPVVPTSSHPPGQAPSRIHGRGGRVEQHAASAATNPQIEFTSPPSANTTTSPPSVSGPYPSQPTISPYQPLAYPFQQLQRPPSNHQQHHPPNGGIQSLDNMRPLPVQHTVTHSKHGVTEYVLSFRDGEDGHPGEGGEMVADAQLQDYTHIDPYYQQTSDGVHHSAPKKEKEKKEKKKKKDKEAPPPPTHGSFMIDETQTAGAPNAALLMTPKRQLTFRHHSSGGDSTTDVDDGAAAASAAVAVKAKKKVKGGPKLCKVAGCGEARMGQEKYCKAHAGPAPLNPNARKMMFQH